MKSRLAEEDARRSHRVREMFSGIAGVYDFLNHFLSGGMDLVWRRRAVRRLPDRSRRRALDLCGGTGDFARALLGQKKSQSVVVADFALPMLLCARRKLEGRPAAYHALDAHFLPYADQSFDVVLSAFGLRNVSDLPRGMDEIARVLPPGGELLVLEFMGGQSRLAYRMFAIYFRHVLPRIGRMVSRDRAAYDYLPQSVQEFHSRSEFAALLEGHGFEVQSQEDVMLGIATITLARRRES